MKLAENKTLKKKESVQLFKLWNNEYPETLQFKTFDEFLNYLENLVNPQHYFMVTEKNEIVGWFFGFERDSNTWFGLLVHHDFQNKGLGKALITKAQDQYTKLYGWVVKENRYKLHNGNTYTSPLDFYLKHGFHIVPNEFLTTNKISTIKIQWTQSR